MSDKLTKKQLAERIAYLEDTVNHLVRTRPYAECNCPCKRSEKASS